MPNIDVNSPISSAPTDRLALGVGWVRSGVVGIGSDLNPSIACACCLCPCLPFEGNEE